jgi:hypothetical protein
MDPNSNTTPRDIEQINNLPSKDSFVRKAPKKSQEPKKAKSKPATKPLKVPKKAGKRVTSKSNPKLSVRETRESQDTDDSDDDSSTNEGGHTEDEIDYDEETTGIEAPILDPIEEEELVEILEKLDYFTCCMFGARRSGKSWMCRYIMHTMRKKWPYVVVISETAFNGFWQEHIPDAYVFGKYDPMIIQKILQRQNKIVEHLKRFPDSINPSLLVIMDDFIHKKQVKYCEWLDLLFVAGRHYKIDIFCLSQYAKGLNPTVRGNTDLAIIYKMYQVKQRESIWEDYGNIVPKKVFYAIMKKNCKSKNETEDGAPVTIFINKEAADTSGDVRKTYRTLKGRDPGKFIMGCREYWQTAMSDGAPKDIRNTKPPRSKPLFGKDYVRE